MTYSLTYEEVEQLFDKYIEEKQNGIPTEECELAGGTTGDAQRETEVIHEVQD